MQELENVNALEHGTRSNEIRAAGQEAVSANHFPGSIVESTRWMVLHRPVEPAALIRQSETLPEWFSKACIFAVTRLSAVG
jgi:hypothetical protein